MSVKTTVRLTLVEAVDKYVDLVTKNPAVIAQLKADAISLGKENLENELCRLNDIAAGGEGFENYRITEWES